jgi:hypothetical protein
MSRPHVLDEAKKSKILALLKSGCGRLTTAAAVNCDPRTIAREARRDPQFAGQLALAEREHALTHLLNLNRAGTQPQYWRASAWILERVLPNEYGKTKPNVVTADQLTALVTEIAEMIVEEVPVDAYRKRIIKRLEVLMRQAEVAISGYPGPPHDVPAIEPPSPELKQHP